jgi:hypothetical protein
MTRLAEDSEPYLPPTCQIVSVYVDDLFVAESQNFAAKKVGERNGHQWCHMWSDEVSELHAFAEKMGMKRQWFQPGERPEGIGRFRITI